ncbi:MAG: TIGR02757 family protein [Syntrophorhabdaceae bacterium]|nr:TIGR02757 family protein [Syntrophorhabdaceae bacterium]
MLNLEAIYEKEKDRLKTLINEDPVQFVHRFKALEDKEVAGFLSSQFAYGRINLFKRFLDELFSRTGDKPSDFIKKGDFSPLEGIYYRFQKSKEIVRLFCILKEIIDRFDTLGGFLSFLYRGDTREAIWNMRKHLSLEEKELTFFFPERITSNPMKRWNLYLRWMVRKDDIDIGVWNFIDKKKLIVPLDTHLFKIGRCLGWTDSITPSYRAALEITEALKKYSPEDPLKYDMLLCHLVGIKGDCSGERGRLCEKRCLLIRGCDFTS